MTGTAPVAGQRGLLTPGTTRSTAGRTSTRSTCRPAPGTVNVEVYDAGLYDRGSNEQIETGDRAVRHRRGHDQVEPVRPRSARSSTTATRRRSQPVRGRPGAFTIAQEQDPGTYKNKWAPLCTMATRVAGRYWLRVETTGPGDGANRYAGAGHLDRAPARPTLVGLPGHEHVQQPAQREPELLPGQGRPDPQGQDVPREPVRPGRDRRARRADGGARPDGHGGAAAARSRGSPTRPTRRVADGHDAHAVLDPDHRTPPAPPSTTASCSRSTSRSRAPTSCTFCWWKIRYNLGSQPERLAGRHDHVVGRHQGRPGAPRRRSRTRRCP